MLSFTFLFATAVVTAHDVEISAADLEERGLLHKLSQEIFANAEPQEDASFNSADASFDSADVHDSEQLELDDAVFEVDLTHTGVCGADTTCWELFEQEIHKLEMDDDTKALLASAESHGNGTMSIVHDPLRRRAYGAGWCSRGIIAHDTCCASSCGTCGGSGCGSREGGSSLCCLSTITRECNSYGDVGCKIPDDGHIPTAGSPPAANDGECWLSIHSDLPTCHLFTFPGRFTPWYDVSYDANGVRSAPCEERVERWQLVVRQQCNLETEVVWMGSSAAQFTAPESRIIFSWGGDLHREFEPYCQVREDVMPVFWDEDGEIREDALGLNNFLSTDGTWDGFEDFETPSECALACARNEECVDWWFAVEAADGTSHCLGFDAMPHLAARIDWPESLEENVNISLSVVGKPCINELPVCFAEYGYDYNGNDINKVPGVKSAEDCANRCYDFIGCNSWTWNTGSRWCNMKAYEPMDPKSNRMAHKNAVSGGPCIRGVGSKAMSNYGWTSTRVAKEVFAKLMMEGTTGSAQTLALALIKAGFYMGLTNLQQTAFHNAWNWFIGFNMSWALKKSALASLTGLPYSLLWSFASTFVFVIANVGFDAYEYSLLEGCTPDCYSNHCNYDTLPWWTPFSVGNGGYGNLQKGVTYRERGVILLTGCCSAFGMFSTDQCNYCCPDGRELKQDEMHAMGLFALGLAQHGINPGPGINIKVPLEDAHEFGIEIPSDLDPSN